MGASPTVPGTQCVRNYYMIKKQVESSTANEPLGIVISQGSRAEQAPRFWAYVWGPAPEAEADVAPRAA
jgi:hypothetical protein